MLRRGKKKKLFKNHGKNREHPVCGLVKPTQSAPAIRPLDNARVALSCFIPVLVPPGSPPNCIFHLKEKIQKQISRTTLTSNSSSQDTSLLLRTILSVYFLPFDTLQTKTPSSQTHTRPFSIKAVLVRGQNQIWNQFLLFQRRALGF